MPLRGFKEVGEKPQHLALISHTILVTGVVPPHLILGWRVKAFGATAWFRVQSGGFQVRHLLKCLDDDGIRLFSPFS